MICRAWRSMGWRKQYISEGMKREVEMSMDCARIWLLLALHALVVAQTTTAPSSNISFQNQKHSSALHPLSAISTMPDWNSEEVTVPNIDATTAKFGETHRRNRGLQVGENVFATKFGDDITSAKHLEDKEGRHGKKMEKSDGGLWESIDLQAALEPFQVEGPLELLIEDTDALQLVLPDSTVIGGFKQLVLAEGAIVNIKGAREVSLAHPIDFSLLLNASIPISGPGINHWSLTVSLRYTTQVEGKPLVALHIVSPILMIAASSGDQDTIKSNIKTRFLAPDVLELSLHRPENCSPVFNGRLCEQKMWPLTSMYTSDLKVLFLEQLLITFLGNRVYREGSFKILRASARVSVFVEIQLELEKKLSKDSFNSELWPPWRTKPAVQRLCFEVLARFEGNRLKPLVIRRLKPFIKVEAHSWGNLMSNISFTSLPSMLFPSGPLTLGV